MATLHGEGFRPVTYLFMTGLLLFTLILCLCVGSVMIPLADTFDVLWSALKGNPSGTQAHQSILLHVRMPRVLCVGLSGAALSLGGAAMQGLLRNPLAEGSTLGVSSGASLGAVLAIALGLSIPGIPFVGTAAMAVLFAFMSLMLILSLSLVLDKSLSTNTLILVGVVFSMFVSSIINIVIALFSKKLHSITFWTMGSLAGSSYADAAMLAVALLLSGLVLFPLAEELNAFAVGEQNAQHVGVSVKRVKLIIMISVCVLVGVCVAVGGTIGFVGLVVPHIVRLIFGPNHKRLLPGAAFLGAVFLLLSDLAARTLFRPAELPIGVVTSLVGAVVFVSILFRSRKAAQS